MIEWLDVKFCNIWNTQHVNFIIRLKLIRKVAGGWHLFAHFHFRMQRSAVILTPSPNCPNISTRPSSVVQPVHESEPSISTSSNADSTKASTSDWISSNEISSQFSIVPEDFLEPIAKFLKTRLSSNRFSSRPVTRLASTAKSYNPERSSIPNLISWGVLRS